MKLTDITTDTEILKGSIVIRTSTKELFKIGVVREARFEMFPNGKNTLVSHGVLFVASKEELAKNYQIVEEQ